MPRFKSNRWWILILTLSLGCTFVVSMSTTAIAQTRIFDELGEGGGTGTPPPPTAGDPDIPLSRGRRVIRGAVVRPTANISTVRVAGDGTPVDSVMMWQLRVVLQSLRLWSFVRL